MAPGSTPRDELIAGIERGIWVTRFHYINPVHPKKAILTGMTKDGTFLIENGRQSAPDPELPVHPVDPRGVQRRRGHRADEHEARCRASSSAPTRVPALHLGSFNFTGVTAAEGGE